MTSYTDGDEPAAPVALNPYQTATGLTKREWFTGMALQGILANEAGTLDAREYAAGSAVAYADRVIEQLNRGEEKPAAPEKSEAD